MVIRSRRDYSGAVIEINILSQYDIKSKEIIEFLKQKEINVTVHNVQAMDSWEYEALGATEYNDGSIKKQVEAGKICTLEVVLNNKYQAGMQQYQENGMYCTDLWIDTSKLLFLDHDKINNANSSFYDEITQFALRSQHSWQWKCIAIGVETYIECKASLKEMIYNSKNVSRWILVKGIVDGLTGYSEQDIDNIQIYSKI